MRACVRRVCVCACVHVCVCVCACVCVWGGCLKVCKDLCGFNNTMCMHDRKVFHNKSINFTQARIFMCTLFVQEIFFSLVCVCVGGGGGGI